MHRCIINRLRDSVFSCKIEQKLERERCFEHQFLFVYRYWSGEGKFNMVAVFIIVNALLDEDKYGTHSIFFF